MEFCSSIKLYLSSITSCSAFLRNAFDVRLVSLSILIVSEKQVWTGAQNVMKPFHRSSDDFSSKNMEFWNPVSV